MDKIIDVLKNTNSNNVFDKLWDIILSGDTPLAIKFIIIVAIIFIVVGIIVGIYKIIVSNSVKKIIEVLSKIASIIAMKIPFLSSKKDITIMEKIFICSRKPEDIKNELKYFIPTRGQQTDPCIREKNGDYQDILERREEDKSNSCNLIKCFIKIFNDEMQEFLDKNKSITAENRIFKRDNAIKETPIYVILGDSGMGKSTFLQKLALDYYKNGKRILHNKNVYYLNLSTQTREDVEEKINNIEKIKMGKKTILLLDSFDEYNEAKIENKKKAVNELIKFIKGKEFHTVLLTSRTQFFPRKEELPENSADDKIAYKRIFISLLTDDEINRYVNKKFKDKNDNKIVKKIMRQSKDALFARPMILSYIDKTWIEDNKKDIAGKEININTIYRTIVHNWIRSDYIVGAENYEQNKDFKKIFNLSKFIAIHMYLVSIGKKGIIENTDTEKESAKAELITIADVEKIYNKYVLNTDDITEKFDKKIFDIDKDKLRSKTLLNRGIDNYYQFSHKSFLEYFIAYAAYEKFPYAKKSMGILNTPYDINFHDFDKNGYNIARIIFEYMIKNDIESYKDNIYCIEDLRNYDFNTIDSKNTLLIGCDLSGINLQDMNLQGIALIDCNLSGCNLSGANLEGTNLQNSIFRDCNLSGAELSNADMTGVDLSNANVARANFYGVKATMSTSLDIIPPIQNNKFKWVDFETIIKRKIKRMREYVIAFGLYPQTAEDIANIKNGEEGKSPIYWYPLIEKPLEKDKDETEINSIIYTKDELDNNINNKTTKVLLLARQGLDCKQYNEKYEDITWAECSLRSWLNNEDYRESFINKAFKGTTRNNLKDKIDNHNLDNNDYIHILETLVTADINPDYKRTKQGRDISDKIFLLSVKEIKRYLPSESSRIVTETRFAEKNGGYRNKDNGGSYWWLRSVGYYSLDAAYVHDDGSLDTNGFIVYDRNNVVCPALWYLNL